MADVLLICAYLIALVIIGFAIWLVWSVNRENVNDTVRCPQCDQQFTGEDSIAHHWYKGCLSVDWGIERE